VQVWFRRRARRIVGRRVVVRDDRIAVEPVQVGPPAGGEVQVLSGLGPGERVVVGDTAAKPGQRVRVREEEGA
jgi:multidrug efflux pump subunit AcrA (membrane-fusion protein)